MASHADKLLAEAASLHGAGRLAEAGAACDKLLATNPHHPNALHLSGLCAYQLGRPDIASPRFALACQFRPDSAEYRFNAARALLDTGQPADALAHLTEALRLMPGQPAIHIATAVALIDLGRFDDADRHLAESLRLAPGNLPALIQRGHLFARQRRGPEALAAYAEALKRQPNDPTLLNQVAAIQRNLGRLSDSVTTLNQLLAAHPTLVPAHVNLGIALQDQGEAAESAAAFERARTLDPTNVPAQQNYLLALNRDDTQSPDQVFQAHLAFARQFEPSVTPPPSPTPGDRTLRIAYLSPDFRDHSVAYFIEPLLKHHDRQRVHVTCYSTTPDPDAVTARLRGLADAWVNAHPLSDEALATRIREDRIDLLIDLAGHTSPRTLVLTRRPAPVQLTYLGYPNTTGLRSVDYRITDALADPPGTTERWHTERLLRLPRTGWCYQPPPDAPDPNSRPDRPITFGSFNTFAKVGPKLLSLWSRVLNAVEGSRLVLKAAALGDPAVQQKVIARFAGHGVRPDRLTLLPYIPSTPSHLSAYDGIDVALDTYPYHGTTTTCEALLMGVPVITLAGQTHASRVGVSLLTSAGLPDLIAPDEDGYVRIARRLATDPARLADLRLTLRNRLLASPICDAASFTRDLESAYRQAWADRCNS
jgi:predicted O-linked N-acetylglucosamine transferase (SPINDLY family)